MVSSDLQATGPRQPVPSRPLGGQRGRRAAISLLPLGSCAAVLFGPWWLAAPATVGAVVYLMWFARDLRRLRAATELVISGQLDHARAAYEQLAGRLMDSSLRRKAWLMIGYIHKRQGNFDAAVEAFERAMSRWHPHERVTLCAAVGCAQIRALRGEESDLPRLPLAMAEKAFVASEVAVIRCRVGHDDAVMAMEGPLLPRSLMRYAEHELRVFALMRAFARHRSGAAVSDAELVGARPAHPGELDYLMSAWPELRAFVEARLGGG